MADKQETTHFTSYELDSMSSRDRFDYFFSQKVIDITNGLSHLIHNADEFFDLHWQILESGRGGRLPILYLKDGRIFMSGGASYRFSHQQLLKNLNLPESDVLYALSSEGMQSNAPVPYLELKALEDGEIFKKRNISRISIRTTSDMFFHLADIPDNKGEEILTKIFGNITGAELCIPKLWKNPDFDKQPA